MFGRCYNYICNNLVAMRVPCNGAFGPQILLPSFLGPHPQFVIWHFILSAEITMHPFDSTEQEIALDDLLKRSDLLMKQSRELSDTSVMKSEYLNLLDEQSQLLISDAHLLFEEIEQRCLSSL